MSEWNPLDPDAESVHYDLSQWSIDQRAAVAEMFAEAEIPHAWVGNEVVVPSELEDAADEMLDALEQELGVGTQEGNSSQRDARRLQLNEATDEEITEYELDEWSMGERSRLTELLVASDIPYRWEGALLVTLTELEDAVDDLLDAVEAGDVTIVDSARNPESGFGTISAGDSSVSGESLTCFLRPNGYNATRSMQMVWAFWCACLTTLKAGVFLLVCPFPCGVKHQKWPINLPMHLLVTISPTSKLHKKLRNDCLSRYVLTSELHIASTLDDSRRIRNLALAANHSYPACVVRAFDVAGRPCTWFWWHFVGRGCGTAFVRCR